MRPVVDVVAAQLRREGTDRVFTLIGGHVATLLNAVASAGIDVIGVRDEDAAVHMAAANARLRGTPGAVILSPGPGFTNGLTGLAAASASRIPVVAIVGRPPTQQWGRGAFQEVDQVGLATPVARDVRTVVDATRAGEIVADAFRLAAAPPGGPVVVELPTDVLRSSVDAEARDPVRVSPPSASAEDLDSLDRLLARSRRPVLVVGERVDGAPRLGDAVAAWGAPVLTTSGARGLLPRQHALNLYAARSFLLATADLVVVLGADVDYTLGYGEPPRLAAGAAVVHVDTDGASLGRNRRPDLALHAEPATVLRARDARSPQADVHPDWLADARARHDRAVAELISSVPAGARPVHPLHLALETVDAAPPRTTFVLDGGDVLSFARLVVQPDEPGRYLDPGPLGCLGVGLPFANAAALERPDDPVICLTGDGALGFHLMEFETAVRLDLPVVVVVSNNAAWAIERNSQIIDHGDDRAVGSLLSDCRFDLVAQALGGRGVRVEDPGAIAPAIRQALDSGLPTIIDVTTDIEAISPDVRRGLARVPDRHALDTFNADSTETT